LSLSLSLSLTHSPTLT
ncbi:unnamed protein product, partial [Medioppia subpectinata]